MGSTPQARIFQLLRRHGKHAIAVLKDERRDVLADARALFPARPRHTFARGKTTFRLWDVEPLTSWESFPEKVRVPSSTARPRSAPSPVHVFAIVLISLLPRSLRAPPPQLSEPLRRSDET